MLASSRIPPRVRFYLQCLSPPLKWIALVYAVLAVVTWVRDELLPEEWRRFHVIDLLPEWPWELWLAIGIFLLGFSLAEGAFRQHRLTEDAKSRRKALFDSSGKVYQPLPSRGKISTVVIPTVITILIAIIWIVYPGPKKLPKPQHKVPTEATETPTAIYMECTMASLPITILPHTTIHLIPLNKKRMQSVKWGFYDIPNDSHIERQWPDKAVMNKATKAHNWARGMIWRCEISNHGALNALDVSMPIKVWFENEKPEITYQAIITPLDAGAKFVFHVVNDCPKHVSAVWPDTVKLQVLGEPHRREVPLRRTFKSPIDQIMMFFGSTTRFIGGEPCE